MALQHIEGTLYKVTYTNNDYTNVSITIVGGYSPEIIWSLAECILPCAKSIWFSADDPSVRIASIEALGDTTEVSNPAAA